MTARTYLDAVERMPFGDLDAIAGPGALVILSPHPDDETLGCGGLIAAAVEAGRTVEVIILTDGSGSHPGSRCYPPDRLVALRRDEVCRAVATLGLPAHCLSFLGLRDTAAPCAGSEFERIVDDLTARVGRAGATSLFVTWDRDPHCDHEAAAAMAREVAVRTAALRLWHYPIWGLHLGDDAALAGDPDGLRFDIAAWQDRKLAAIACYPSQMTALIDDDPAGFHFTEDTLAPFLTPHERFLVPNP